MRKAVKEVIELLEKEPENWKQGRFTLEYSNANLRLHIEIWTANLPYIDCGIWWPHIKTTLWERIQLQRAVNKWHKNISLFKKQ